MNTELTKKNCFLKEKITRLLEKLNENYKPSNLFVSEYHLNLLKRDEEEETPTRPSVLILFCTL